MVSALLKLRTDTFPFRCIPQVHAHHKLRCRCMCGSDVCDVGMAVLTWNFSRCLPM